MRPTLCARSCLRSCSLPVTQQEPWGTDSRQRLLGTQVPQDHQGNTVATRTGTWVLLLSHLWPVQETVEPWHQLSPPAAIHPKSFYKTLYISPNFSSVMADQPTDFECNFLIELYEVFQGRRQNYVESIKIRVTFLSCIFTFYYYFELMFSISKSLTNFTFHNQKWNLFHNSCSLSYRKHKITVSYIHELRYNRAPSGHCFPEQGPEKPIHSIHFPTLQSACSKSTQWYRWYIDSTAMHPAQLRVFHPDRASPSAPRVISIKFKHNSWESGT